MCARCGLLNIRTSKGCSQGGPRPPWARARAFPCVRRHFHARQRKATQGPQARVALAHCAQAQALRFRVFWPHRNVKRVADQARQDIQELWEVQHAVGMACLVVDKGLELLQRKIRVERAGGPEVGTPRAHVSSACGGCAHHTKTRRAVQRATALVLHITSGISAGPLRLSFRRHRLHMALLRHTRTRTPGRHGGRQPCLARSPEEARTVQEHEGRVQLLNLPRAHLVDHGQAV